MCYLHIWLSKSSFCFAVVCCFFVYVCKCLPAFLGIYVTNRVCPLAYKWLNYIDFQVEILHKYYLPINVYVLVHSWNVRVSKIAKHANGKQKHWVTHQPAIQPTAQQISVQTCLFYLYGTINQIPFVKLGVWYLKKKNNNSTNNNSQIFFICRTTAFTIHNGLTHFLYSRFTALRFII